MAHQAVKRPPEETLSLWKREQARLKALVVDWDTETWQRDPTFSGLQRVGGVDVSFVKGDSVRACASLVVLSFPELEVVYEDSRMVSLTAPYVSGFLAFREVPFLMELVQRLQEKEPSLMPQVVLVDGNGVLHQRGFGVACHLGVLTELPCIGVAKKLLQVDGLENNALHKEKIRLLQAGGNTFPLMGSSGTVLGMALKSHDHSTKPLYISVGHRTSLEAAVRLTYRCCRFRVPEPVRQADIRSREYIRRTVGQPESPAPGEESIRSQEQRPAACSQAGPEAPAGQGRPPNVTAEALAQMQKALSQAPRNSRRTSNEAAGHQEDSVTSLRGCSLGTPQQQVVHQASGVTCENPQQDAADSPAWAGGRPPLPALAQQHGHCATAGSHSIPESTPSHPECMKPCL